MSTVTIHVNKNLLGDYARIAEKVGPLIHAAAFQIELAAKINAPVDTGNLMNSIHAYPMGEMSAEITAEADYSGFVEYGTRHMAAQPFMEPAFEEIKPELIDAIRDAMRLG